MSHHHSALHRNRWAIVRRYVFERDGWRCVECGRAGKLECGHITSLECEPRQDPYDVNGLQTLCRECHIAKTAKVNRCEPTPGELVWYDLVNELL